MKRIRLHHIVSLVLLVVITSLLLSCSNEKRLAKGKPLKSRSSSAILSRYYDTEFTYEWVGMKLAAEVEGPDGKQSFKANLRMRKDSVIWVSVSPLLGVEVLRMIITPDSVKYVSKVPNNKHYFIGTIDELTALTKTEISFDMIEDMLLGNAVDLNEEDDKFISRVDQQEYVLISKYNRRLKKVVGVDEKDLSPDDSLEVDTNNRRYRRILKKADEEELLIKRYWFDGYDYRLHRTIFDDLYYQRSFEIEHRTFTEHAGQYYPELTLVTLGTIEGNTVFSFEITRLKTNKEYDFPFDIPEDFERKYAP